MSAACGRALRACRSFHKRAGAFGTSGESVARAASNPFAAGHGDGAPIWRTVDARRKVRDAGRMARHRHKTGQRDRTLNLKPALPQPDGCGKLRAIMFCPLCKAEYRDGFTQCSDCRLPLLATQEEAAAAGVRRLWTGSSRRDFEDILTALAQAEILCHSRETLTTRPGPWLSMLLWQFMRPRSTAVFWVDVREADSDRARQASRHVLDPEPLDE